MQIAKNPCDTRRRAHGTPAATEMPRCRHCRKPLGLQPLIRSTIGCPRCGGWTPYVPPLQ